MEERRSSDEEDIIEEAIVEDLPNTFGKNDSALMKAILKGAADEFDQPDNETPGNRFTSFSKVVVSKYRSSPNKSNSPRSRVSGSSSEHDEEAFLL